MELWVRSAVDDARFTMLQRLEENVEKSHDNAERIYALSALRICRTLWDELTRKIPTVAHADPNMCPEQRFDNMMKMNLTLRAQLKEANKVARSVYNIVVGPMPSSSRTIESAFSVLEDGVKSVRREMFILQHGQESESEFEDISFSIRDFLQLADFKMSHAAKRIFEVETNAVNDANGSGIDWEFRMQEITRDLQAQVVRAQRAVDTEKLVAAEQLKSLRTELDGVKGEYSGLLADLKAQQDKTVKSMKLAFETDINDLADELSRRLQDLQINFVHKLGEMRDLDAESKAAAIRALQQVLAVERQRIEDKALQLGNADAAIERQATRYVGDVAVFEDFEDMHNPWEGETYETLIRLLKGKKAELDVMQQSFNVQNRLRNMEWETNLREVIRRYEEEISRMKEKMKHLEAEAEHAAKIVTIRMQETADARAELQRAQRQAQDEMYRALQKHDAEMAAMNQQVIQLTESYVKSADTVATQEKQLRELNEYKKELVRDLETTHDQLIATSELLENVQTKWSVVEEARSAAVEVACQTEGKVGRMLDDDRQPSNGLRSVASANAAMQRILRNKDRNDIGGAEMEELMLDSNGQLIRKGDGSLSPAPPSATNVATTQHSRRDSLASRYRKGKKHASLDALDGADDDSGSDDDGVLVPSQETVDRAKRKIVSDTARGSGDDSPTVSPPPPAPIPTQRRKSKFSLWYEEQQKLKLEAATQGAAAASSGSFGGKGTTASSGRFSSVSPGGQRRKDRATHLPPTDSQRNATGAMVSGLSTADKDWITESLDPDYLARLLAPDPIDAKILSNHDFGPQRVIPNGGTALSVVAPIERIEDALTRLINEPNFLRVICKIALAVELATSVPSQHTQSQNIKKLTSLLPNSASLLNTTVVRPVNAVDLSSIGHFLERVWIPKIERVRAYSAVVDGQLQAKESLSHSLAVIQQLRNLEVPRSVEYIPLEVLQQYVVQESNGLSRGRRGGASSVVGGMSQLVSPPQTPVPGSSRAPSRQSKGKNGAQFLKPLNIADIRPILTSIIPVVQFMFTTGRAAGSHPTTTATSDEGAMMIHVGEMDGNGGGVVTPTPPARDTESPQIFKYKAMSTGEAREAVVIVSNMRLLSKPIAHLVDANNIIAQTDALKKTSEQAINRRVSSAAPTPTNV